MRAHQILQLRFAVLRYSISPLFSISTPRPKTLSRQKGEEEICDRITLRLSETTSTVCLAGQDIRSHNTVRPRVGQWPMCLCIHTDVIPLISPYIKKRKTITSLYITFILHVKTATCFGYTYRCH
jgi:hypothetical protein